jgi:hypothetical protein
VTTVPSPISLLTRYGIAAAQAFDVVAFAARCPACGADAEWVQQREDTRVRIDVRCSAPRCRPPGP